jgi:HD-like signal output (HDOD) protein
MGMDKYFDAVDLDRLVGGVDALAAERPIAAQLIAAAGAEETDANGLAAILSADVALSVRVMKLANSAYFGMRGRVSSLQLAVTVIGFTTLRTMATVALTEPDDGTRLPEDFRDSGWTTAPRRPVVCCADATRWCHAWC